MNTAIYRRVYRNAFRITKSHDAAHHAAMTALKGLVK